MGNAPVAARTDPTCVGPRRKRPRTLSELIDRIEQMRDELLEIQQHLERKERADPPQQQQFGK